MSDAAAPGAEVAAGENLYRAVTQKEWWDLTVDPPRVRSFAFKVASPFSVNVASLMDLSGAVRHLCDVLHCAAGGIVTFNCGVARALGFNARHEADPHYPDNQAHANVYYEGEGSKPKTAAKRLAQSCTTVHKPSFG